MNEVPHHLFLPKQSLDDVRKLLRLDEEQIFALEELLGTSESISPRSPDFVQKVAERINVDLDAAASILLVGQFLLTVVEDGHPPDEIIDDVRQFVEQFPEERDLLATVEKKRKLLESMITPKPERARALKIRYLQSIYPTAESFRSVCELRPVFDRNGDTEEIVGFVPTILLEVKQTNAEGEESQIVLNLSPAALKLLSSVVKRAEEKMITIKSRFEDQLLGSNAP